MTAGLGLLENRPLTDSPEKAHSLSVLCALNESSLEDEWAVKEGTDVKWRVGKYFLYLPQEETVYYLEREISSWIMYHRRMVY